jgi:cell division transport system permease protein
MALSLFLLSVFASVAAISYSVLRYLETRAQITVFYKDSVLESDIVSQQENLKKDKNIADVVYTSKEGALDKYINDNKDEPLLLESLSRDIFPASLDIRTKDISYLSTIEQFFKSQEGVEEVVYYKDAVNSFKQFSNIVIYGGGVLVFLLLCVSTVTILLTIGSSIYIKNEEIAVMRLVGASNWFIRGPFLAQGVFYGIVGAILSETVLIIIVAIMGNDIGNLFRGMGVISINWLYLIILFFSQILFGTLLGLSASWGALRRYLEI